MDKHVNNIVEQLSNIEANAVRIMNATDNRKKELIQEMNVLTNSFDTKLEEETNQKLEQARYRFNEEKASKLSILKEQTVDAIKYIENKYEEKHTVLAKELFEKIIKV